MHIEINMDNVIIEKQVVKRPDYISRAQWLEWWESAMIAKKKYDYSKAHGVLT